MLLNSINEFDYGIDYTKDSSDDSYVKACHAYLDIRLVGIVVDIVESNKDLEDDHTGSVDNFDDYF